MSAAERMARIFRGNPDAFYVADFKNLTVEDSGKRVPKYSSMRRAPTVEDFQRHLDGTLGMLIVPVTHDGKAYFGKIDVDDYPADHADLARRIRKHGLPLVVERTKSNGAHLAHYRPGNAAAADDLCGKLCEWAVMLGCSTKVEIFPKQSTAGDIGNGINLPYFGGERAENYAVDADGQRLSVTQWLDLIESMPSELAHTPGEVHVEAAADLLAQHWTDGQRDNLNLAAAGAMLRAGVDESLVQAILDAASSAGADNEQRRSAAAVQKALDGGQRIPGLPKLKEMMGDGPALEFMRLVGAKPPKDPLPITFQTFDTTWANERLPPQVYVVERLIPPKCVTLLIAEGGAGKTTFSLHAAVSVAAGRPLFGKPVSPGPVCYVGREDNEESLRRRLYTIVNAERERMRRENLSPEAIDKFNQSLADNFHWAAAVGIQMHLVSTMSGQTTQTALIDLLLAKLPQPLRLLILDPLARFHGGEENSNSVGTGLMDACELFAQRAGCAVLMPHHTGKAAAKDRDQSQYSARGASALVDSSRSAIRLIVASPEEANEFANVPSDVIAAGDLVAITHVKNSTGKKDDKFYLRRQELGFELFVPEKDGGRGRGERLLTALYDWWAGPNERRPFAKKQIADNNAKRAEVFGPGAVGRDAARALIDEAAMVGDLVPGERAAHAHVAGLVFREGYEPRGM